MKKIGRNDPCPCGSGKKYKKCCGFSQQPSNIPIEVMKQIKKNKERVRKYGHVRPGISLNFHDYKMVAVGNQVHYCKKWKTFHDFLFDYIKNCLGQEWGKEELKKNISEMHPILQWYKEVCEFQKTNFINPLPNFFNLFFIMFNNCCSKFMLNRRNQFHTLLNFY